MTEGEDKKASQARSAVGAAAGGEIVARTTTLHDLVFDQQAQLGKVLPPGMEVSRFVHIVDTELRRNPKLELCSPRSFVGSVYEAARMGLEFGPAAGQAYLVPYKTRKKVGGSWVSVPEVQLIVGYKGWVKLAYQSGIVVSINGAIVRAGDEFEYEYGLDEKLVHKPKDDDEDRDPIAYWVVIRTAGGGRVWHVLTQADALRHRERYGHKNDSGAFTGPWGTDFPAMALKTCFLHQRRWLPASAVFNQAASVDGAVTRRDSFEPDDSVPEDVEWPDADVEDDDEVHEGEVVG